MQVSVEEAGSIVRKLTVSIPSEVIQSDVSKRLQELARQAKVPGFRPGKVPQSVIRQRYGSGVTNEVISETIKSSYVDALRQASITPASLVSIDPEPYQPEQDLQYVATVELFPSIPHTSLEGQTVVKPVVEVGAEDIERTLEDIRTRHASYTPKEGGAESGDRLTIDFDGTIGGETFAGGTAQDFQFTLGQGEMLEPFEAGLTAASAGEEKTIAFQFPEDYGSTDIAGKDVVFKVTVKVVEQPQLAELDDAFAERLGITEGGIQQMRTEVENNLKRELENRLRTTMRDRVMEALYIINSIELPQAMVEEELDRIVQETNRLLEARGLPPDRIDRDHYAGEAHKRVAMGLIARGVVEKHALHADEQNVQDKVREMAQSYEDPETFISQALADQTLRQRFEGLVLEEQIVARMLETADIEEEEISFKDFMSPATGA